eukprot:scaffold8753_cov128-Isochrysis_galbana.AAC.1
MAGVIRLLATETKPRMEPYNLEVLVKALALQPAFGVQNYPRVKIVPRPQSVRVYEQCGFDFGQLLHKVHFSGNLGQQRLRSRCCRDGIADATSIPCRLCPRT